MNRSIIIFPVLLVIVCFSFGKHKAVAYDLKYIEKNLVQVPAGSFHMGSSDMDIPENVHVSPAKMVSIAGFYLFNQEITNGFYCFYLNDLRSGGDTAIYHKALPDTLVWREKLVYNEPYVDYYLRHPAYRDYPLVGVSYDQCLGFCDWLTQKYNALPGRKFNKVKFDLPTEAEWEYAALGGNPNGIFPWNGPYMQSREKSFRGDWMANFASMDQGSIMRVEVETNNVYGKSEKRTYYMCSHSSYMGVAGVFNDAADITAPSHSYWPNAYGLYNMSGNVEEMVSEKGISKGGSWRDPGYYLRIQSRETYAIDASNERGFRISMRVLE